MSCERCQMDSINLGIELYLESSCIGVRHQDPYEMNYLESHIPLTSLDARG